MKNKNKKLLKTFDKGEIAVYQVCYYPTSKCVYFTEKPNKSQLKSIANQYFEIFELPYPAYQDQLAHFTIEKISVYNL